MSKYFHNSLFVKYPLVGLVIVGFIVRVIFVLFGASVYYAKPDLPYFGDCGDYIGMMQNLIEHGSFALNLNDPWSYVYRVPGYSLFLGLFYFVTGKDMALALDISVWLQVFLDTAGIYLIYTIIINSVSNRKLALISASLFSIYPFAFVWVAVIHAETVSLFWLLLSVHLFYSHIKGNYFLSGICIAISFLTRVQIVVILPAFILTIFLNYRKAGIQCVLKRSLLFFFGVLLIYLPWPVRNIIVHEKFVFFNDLRSDLGEDLRAFRRYFFFIQTDFEPQQSQIVSGDKVTIPRIALANSEDSIKIFEMIRLERLCGSGANIWKGINLKDSNCNEKIILMAEELKRNFISKHLFHALVWVPLSNLIKSIFKSNLLAADQKSRKNLVHEKEYIKQSAPVFLITGFLFSYRTILILLGIYGLYLGFFQMHGSQHLFFLIGCYSFTWYFLLCFVLRYIEIRYLIYTDVLLLIPGSYSIISLFNRVFSSFNKNNFKL